MSWRNVFAGRRGELILLALLVVLAAWLRLSSLDLCEYKSDEALAVDLTLPLIEGRAFPLVGLRSSVGINNPPLMMYLLAPPLLLKVDPLLATGFVGLLGTLAVALCYFVLRSRFGYFVALAACALFATAPWAVLYSRKIWAQDFLPIFSVLLLHALFAVLERAKTWWALALPVLACALWQLHFSAFALFGVIGLVLLYRARTVRWTALAIGVVLAVGMLTPYLVHQVRHGWDDFARIKGFVTGAKKKAKPGPKRHRDLRSLDFTARIVGASGWSYVTGPSHQTFVAKAGFGRVAGQAASGVAMTLLFAGFLMLLLRLIRRARWIRAFPFIELDIAEERRGLLVLWLGGVWAFFVMARLDGVYPHYLIIAYPVPFVVIALCLADLRDLLPERWRPIGRWAAAGLAGLLVLGYVGFNVSFTGFVHETGGTAGDYGVAYRHKNDLVEFARRHRLRVVGAGYEVQRLIAIRARYGQPIAPAPTTAVGGRWLQVGNRLRGRVPGCAPTRTRRFGPLVACVRP